ncbi:MAG TPA: alpha/beta fold hydrolase [Acetobacteraceae bacterium]
MSRSHPVHVPADPAPLHSTLLLPDGTGPHPALILLPGSGPVDRDGNLPGLVNNSLRLLAEGLAEQGIATLRADKRGVGASHAAAPDEALLRLETYVDDTVRWMRALGGDPAVARVGLLGHSEGALIAMLAAQRAALDRLVLVAGAGSPAGPALLRQLAAGGTPPELVAAARGIVARLLGGEAVAQVPRELAGLFRPSVQPYLTSWLLRDPAAELAAVRCPVLVVQGAADLQMQLSDARLLAASCPGARLLLVPAMNHVLKAPAEGRAANLAAYADPGLPLAAGLVEGIARFVLG